MRNSEFEFWPLQLLSLIANNWATLMGPQQKYLTKRKILIKELYKEFNKKIQSNTCEFSLVDKRYCIIYN